MNKRRNWILLCAAGAVVAGLALAAAGAFLMGWPLLPFREGPSVTEEHMTPAGLGLTERTLTFDPDCREIATELAAVDLVIRAADREDIQVRWWENGEDEYRVWEDGGVLRAEYHTDSAWYGHVWFGIGWDDQRCRMEIEVPRDYKGALSLGASSGTITAEGLSFGADSGVDATSGDIKLTDCTFEGALSVGATSGEVELENLTGEGSLSAGATSGDVTLRRVSATENIQIGRTSGDLSAAGVDCGGTLEVSGTSGDNDLERVSARILRLTSSSGQVEGEDLEVRRALEIQTSSGDVTCTLAGGREDYDITVNTSSGDTNLPQRGSYGEVVLDVSTSSGDIYVGFNGD